MKSDPPAAILPGQTVLVCVIIIVCILGCLSCGRKALPTPETAIAPPLITGVAANIKGDTLFLTWPVPEWKTENGDRLAGFYVYRLTEDMADPLCEGCPHLFQKAATLNIEQKRAGEDVLYTEPVKKGFRYFYRVSCYTEDDEEGEKSETVTIIP